MGKDVHDVVVIGAGIIGITTAYFLAKTGQDVCVVERGAIGGESSGRCGGNIGQSHREPPDLPIMMHAVDLWEKFREEADVDFEYRQQGNLRLMWDEDHAAQLMAMVKRERAAGLDSRLLDRAETRALVPFVPDVVLGSVHCPSDGSADPFRTCWAFSRLAARQGVKFRERTEVTGIQVTKGRVSAVETNAGTIATRVVVNAANAWSGEIGRMVGVKIPVDIRRSHILITERVPQFLGPVLSTDRYGYYRQTVAGNVVLGFAARPQQGYDRRVTDEAVTTTARRVAWIIPPLKNASVIRAFTGFTAWTSDNLPIIGSVSEPEGFFIAAVFCGLGFAIGPAIGELTAELIMNGRTSFSIDAYRLERFNKTTQ